ncbi:MAG: glycoside hydrolase family 38 C-terminal domain-containing protein, partial [Promethearchaeia archaeon]
MTNLEQGVTIEIDQTLHWYEAAQAGAEDKLCGDGQQKSGAYIFRPNNTAADGGDAACVNADCRATLRVLKTQLVSEVEQVFSPWATQTVRLYAGARHVEVEWTIGPVPIQDGKGKEVVSRYRTSISSAGAFLTDSNGREMLRRTRCDPREGAVDLTCRGSVRDVCLRCMIRACCCVR